MTGFHILLLNFTPVTLLMSSSSFRKYQVLLDNRTYLITIIHFDLDITDQNDKKFHMITITAHTHC